MLQSNYQAFIGYLFIVMQKFSPDSNDKKGLVHKNKTKSFILLFIEQCLG